MARKTSGRSAAGVAAWILIASTGGGCGGGTPAGQVPVVEDPRALAIAADYKGWGRVDDELRFAPFLCRQPLPGVARESTSTDAPTHGQKLYSVFAKDHAGYPTPAMPGQVVVKESFVAELVTDPSVVYEPSCGASCQDASANHFYPYAEKDGKIFRAGAFVGLFVMYRLEAGSAGTDDGWIYSTLDAEHKVTASGKLDACISCHEHAPNGRLFGVPSAPKG